MPIDLTQDLNKTSSATKLDVSDASTSTNPEYTLRPQAPNELPMTEVGGTLANPVVPDPNTAFLQYNPNTAQYEEVSGEATTTTTTVSSDPYDVSDFKYNLEGSNLKSFYNNLIQAPFWASNPKDKGEHIDIISNYGWHAEKTVGGKNGTYTHGIPFILCIERKQIVNSSIMNYVNLLYAGGYGARAADSALNTIRGNALSQNVIGQLGTTAGKTAAQIAGTAFNTIKGWVSEGNKRLLDGDPDLKDFLQPYRYLYYTLPTGKNFVFPMLNPGESYLSLQGTWNSENQVAGILSNIFTGIFDSFSTATAMLSNDIVAIAQAVSMQNTSIEQAYIEKAKAYNFPEEGQTVKCTFVLYNTCQKDIWKKHYRFLYLFAVRNLPYKISPYSYIPPLLYDVKMPGYKRLPLCYVSNFQVLQHGVTRMLTQDSIFGSSRKVSISVPDAWQVTIEFKSLLSPSANLMLQENSTGEEVAVTGISGGGVQEGKDIYAYGGLMEDANYAGNANQSNINVSKVVTV